MKFDPYIKQRIKVTCPKCGWKDSFLFNHEDILTAILQGSCPAPGCKSAVAVERAQ